jgi:sensor histidine kinase YesM
MIGNIIATVFLLMVVTGLILHKSHVMDIYAFSFILNIAAMIVMIAMGIVLFKESKEEKKIGEILIAWAPLILSILLDGLNKIFYFTDIHFYYFGLSITMFYQIFRIIIDLRTQHREAIRYEKMQKELYEAQVGVMVSQIQPHFMYNALSSIAMMCTLDGKKAKEATITFAKYLRGNMDSLKQKKPVPFSQELEHLKKYLYIEKMRFEEALNIVYDIETEDFVLPQLSIQPLVENAVKHGVGMKEDGGTVTIATRETDEDFRVIISDDGVGFDTNAPKAEDGRSHVGMENTKRRIADLCGGSVVIESTPGEGTVATVILPKSGQPTE